MARGELLRKLFQSHRRGNDEEFRSVALRVIAEEERKNNHRLAEDLKRILENGARPASAKRLSGTSVPRDEERQTLLVDVRDPQRTLAEIVLTQSGSEVIGRVLREYRQSELLRAHGLQPATKLLFCGPPGCGKTLCAEVIASELGLPLLYTRFDAVVSSYLGETAANLRKVFDYASSGRWVVLFDEFDAIGKARDDASEHGELKRVINSFLQLLDSFVSPSILVAATNHEQLLDPALWRRFDEVMMFPRPTIHDIRTLIRQKLRNFPQSLDIKEAASKMRGMTHADVEQVCLSAVKAAILDERDIVDSALFADAVAKQRTRLAMSEGDGRPR